MPLVDTGECAVSSFLTVEEKVVLSPLACVYCT